MKKLAICITNVFKIFRTGKQSRGCIRRLNVTLGYHNVVNTKFTNHSSFTIFVGILYIIIRTEIRLTKSYELNQHK